MVLPFIHIGYHVFKIFLIGYHVFQISYRSPRFKKFLVLIWVDGRYLRMEQ